ncbi:hypothetical protein ACGFJT_29520 [Actinomadura geliboluensis]|uniref:hypothetical protein n=1 Tax=Actinomadura geliboluensis TaxID=882440 RepID=UPI003715326A
MTAVVLALAVFAAMCWLCLSPMRLAGAGAVLLITYPVPTFVLTTVAVLALAVGAARLAYRSLREGGWCLVTVQRPAYAMSRAGGVAS